MANSALSQAAKAQFDPVRVQILWNRLIAIADEAHATLVRTAFSTAVSESNDCAVVITDAAGNSLAQNSLSPPSYVSVLPKVVKAFLNDPPGGPLRPGDVLMTNDPWIGSGHLPDIIMVEPIFCGDKLVAFGTAAAHTSDIGGLMWAADASDVLEEGIRLPPMKLCRNGRPSTQILDILAANVRQPEQILGDIHAQLAALNTVRNGVQELLNDSQSNSLEELSFEILTRSERAMRTAIRNLPDGSYEHAIRLDGFDEPTLLKLKMTISGDRINLDFAGSSKQVTKGINSPLNFTTAYALYPLKCVLDPTTPQTEGAYRAVTVEATPGSILNALYPAPVGARHLTGQCVSNLVLATLSRVIPQIAVGEAGSTPGLRVVFSGYRSDGQRFTTILFASGGIGARNGQDGLDCTPFPSNTACASMEVMESTAPIRFLRRELAAGSGGTGQYRGGLGQEIALELTTAESCRLSMLADRVVHPAEGILGGGPGGSTLLMLGDEPIAPKGRAVMMRGQVLTIVYPGGGGYGDPKKRDRALVAADVQNRLVSAKSAFEDYGSQEEKSAETVR
jgi:N-methylhydantoinase B